MKVIKDNNIVEDSWQYIEEVSEELPTGDLIVPFDYWLEKQSELNQHDGQIAVSINGAVETEQVAEHLERFQLIALEFPVFADGRSYSHARLLRDRYAYRGELRAVGDVLRDQLFYMKRCGIDSFALRRDKDFNDALKAFKEFSVTYQNAADGAMPIYKVR